jgi:catechol 2,3-dioxygenase-like lactoylglutathione lyase family enzyme
MPFTYAEQARSVLQMAIDHFGLGVPDVEAAKAYYDDFMPLVGFVRERETGYRPTDWQGEPRSSSIRRSRMATTHGTASGFSTSPSKSRAGHMYSESTSGRRTADTR